MKRPRIISAVLLATASVVVAASLSAQTADTNSVGSATTVREGQIALPGSSSLSGVTGPVAVERPDRPERVALPQDVRARLQEFERMRESYLAKQQELLRKLHGASDTDRARIRELLRDQKQAWQEQARRFREEAQHRLEELKIELPRHRELIDEAQLKAREAKQRAKDRTGQD